jgi:hypothetical protein
LVIYVAKFVKGRTFFSVVDILAKALAEYGFCSNLPALSPLSPSLPSSPPQPPPRPSASPISVLALTNPSCPLSVLSLSSVLCPLSSVLCPLSSVLCPLSSVLCPLSSVLCPSSPYFRENINPDIRIVAISGIISIFHENFTFPQTDKTLYVKSSSKLSEKKPIFFSIR